MQVNPPVALVESEPEVQVRLVVGPLQVRVTVDDPMNPVPVAVVELPTIPADGVRTRFDPTRYVAVAELLDVSVAVTRWPPWTAAGTVNEQEKKPVAFVVALQRARAPGAQVTEVTSAPPNPFPIAVEVDPTTPTAGASARLETIVNVLVAELDDASVAVTEWGPATAGGTWKAQVNDPVAPVTSEPLVHTRPMLGAVQVRPTFEVPANPVPEAVVLLPTIPLVGLRTSFAVTVNEVVAKSLAASVPVTVWAPLTAAGTTKEQLKSPVGFVVEVHRVAPPGDQETVTAELAAYPWPVAVTGVATGPTETLKEIEGATVNVALAIWAPALPVTTFAPIGALGTVIEQLQSPTAPTVPVGVQLTAPPEKVTENDVPLGNPAPVTTTLVPTIPPVGLRLKLGATVNVAVALLLDASVPVTVWAPVTAWGTVKVQVNDPTLDEEAVHNVAPPGDQVTVTEALPAYPVPEAVAELPTIPDEGARERLALTVKVALALLPDPSAATRVWAPWTEGGTVNVRSYEPVAGEDAELPTIVAPSQVSGLGKINNDDP